MKFLPTSEPLHRMFPLTRMMFPKYAHRSLPNYHLKKKMKLYLTSSFKQYFLLIKSQTITTTWESQSLSHNQSIKSKEQNNLINSIYNKFLSLLLYSICFSLRKSKVKWKTSLFHSRNNLSQIEHCQFWSPAQCYRLFNRVF